MISHSPQITVFFKNMMAQLQPALQVINYSDPKVQATIRALLHHINPTIPSPAVSFLYRWLRNLPEERRRVVVGWRAGCWSMTPFWAGKESLRHSHALVMTYDNEKGPWPYTADWLYNTLPRPCHQPSDPDFQAGNALPTVPAFCLLVAAAVNLALLYLRRRQEE